MTIEVEVLYADLSRQVATLDAVADLSKASVIAVVVRTDQETGKKRNIAFSHGFDSYALCWKQDAGQPHIMLFGWDDGDFKWRRTSNHLDNDAVREVDMPLGCLHVIFRGQSVTETQLEKALEILNADIL